MILSLEQPCKHAVVVVVIHSRINHNVFSRRSPRLDLVLVLVLLLLLRARSVGGAGEPRGRSAQSLSLIHI